MIITCPGCAARYDLDVAITEEKARQFFGLVADCPPDFVGPLIRYLRLHKPAKSALSWAKCHKIAAELVPMVKAARVERDGIVKAAPVALWVECVEQLLNDPPAHMRTPLKGNGYLLSIVAAQAERHLAKAESAREQERRRGITDDGERQGLKSIQELSKHLGSDE